MNDNNIEKDKKQRAKLELDSNFKFTGKEPLKVSLQGDKFAEATFIARTPKPTVRRIDKDRYLVIKTGEIKEYSNSNIYKQNEALRRTFTRLMGLIRNNFTSESQNQLFITLTYEENMTDKVRLYNDFKIFMKTLRRKYKDHKLEYIAVAEPQGRGAWHFHVMLKTDKPVLYIDNKEMERLWSHGMTDTERLKSDDVGTYYVAYFTDIIESDNKPIKRNEMSKKRQKGERLKYYPKGFNFYRASRGIKKPQEIEMTYDEVVKRYGKPKYLKAFNLKEGEKVINVIAKASFKKVRVSDEN